MTVLSSLIVRPAILQNDPNQPQPFVCFILPDSSTISQPFIPVLVAVILPSEISQNFSLSDFFVFAENDFVPTFSLTDQPIFDEKTNSFVWLFVGFYEFPIEQAPEQSPNLIPLTLSAYALFEPNEPSLSPISAYDEFPVLIDLTSFEGEEGRQEGNESAEAESSGHEKSEKSDKGESEKGQFSEEKSSSQSKGALAKEAVRGAIGKDPELAMKVFEQEITARALSNAKKNPKSTAKGNGLVITVGAYPDVLPADGRSTAFIVAKVTDEKGNPLSGREVQFTSDGGQILVRKAKTDGQGIVLSRLCSEKLPKGKKKIVTIKAKTNPEAETTVTLDGSLTPLSTSSSSGSVSVFWWSNPPNQQSMVCSSGGGSASGFAGIAQHVIVPSSPPHFVWHNFTKVTGDGHPSQLGLAINLQPENSSTCSPPVGQDQQRYSFIIYPEPFGWQRFHRSSITIRFNYTVARPYPPPGQSWTEEVVVTVNAQNAVLQLSPNNPPLFVWDPENPPPAEKRTVSFTVNTLQTAQVECTLSIYSTRRANGEGPVKTIVEYKPTNTPVSMTWDGTIDGGMPWMPSFAEKGVYAYDLMVRVQQIVPNRFDPDWKASRNMTIERAVDANGQQIFDAEYYGYDDKGTETIEDDDHLYFIRWYVLKCASAYFDDDGDAANELHVDRDGDRRFDEDWVDGIDNDGDGRIDEDPGGGWDEDPPGDFGGDGNLDDDFDGRVDEDGPNPVNASRGEVILYDPDLEAVKTWDLQSLLCLEHNENDGLVASLEGVRHGVLVPVPVSLMQKAGTYYFVLRVWDNHAHLHKDHQVKPALEMNVNGGVLDVVLTFDDGPHAAPLGQGTNRTEKVLDTLKSKAKNGFADGIKAGFFIQVYSTTTGTKDGFFFRANTPSGKILVQRMGTEGHIVGIHTGSYEDHQLHTLRVKVDGLANRDDLLFQDFDEVEEDPGIGRATMKFIQTYAGALPEFVRPPGGAYNDEVTRVYNHFKLKNILWDVDSKDNQKGATVESIKSALRTGVHQAIDANKKEIIVLLHDINDLTADNLPDFMQEIANAAKTKGRVARFVTSTDRVRQIMMSKKKN